MSVSLPDSATAFWRVVSFRLPILRAWTRIWWGAMSAVGRWTFVSYCFDRLGAITPRRRPISTFAQRPLRRVAECMACAAIMQRKWRCPGCLAASLSTRKPARIAACAHSRGVTAGHSTPWIFPSDSRSIVGAYSPIELTPPPQTLSSFFGHGGEPILPDHGAYLARGPIWKGILCKEIEHVAVVGEQPHFGRRTIGYSCHDPNEANQRFQSNRG